MTRATARFALVGLAAACVAAGCVGADIGEGEDPGLEEIEFVADNGIFLDNGLNLPNGMNLGNGTVLHNGMNLGNGVDLANGMNLGNGLNLGNGITGPFYAPPAGSGLEQWIDVDPPARKKILRYLVECALPAGVEVQLLYRGTLEALGHGITDLGPSLQSGAMSTVDQERVSACMLARMNGSGQTVQIDMFGPMGADKMGQFEYATESDDPFTFLEAAFFGNLFSAAPAAHACRAVPYALADMRSCKDLGAGQPDCGVIAFTVDACGSWRDQFVTCTPASTGGTQRDYFTACVAGGRVWQHALTTYLLPRPVGEACFSDPSCASGICADGVCAATRTPSVQLANGQICMSASQCLSGSCQLGVCGAAPGTRCYSSSQCASNVCSAKRKVCQ